MTSMASHVLVDAGALVTIIDHDQPRSDACRALVATLPLPLVTTWAAYTEAMYLLFGIGGWPMQRDLWGYVESGVLRLHTSNEAEPNRMMYLMEKYRDRPMDLADATLVAAAETLGTARILTLDHDFFIYRLRESDAFEVLGLP